MLQCISQSSRSHSLSFVVTRQFSSSTSVNFQSVKIERTKNPKQKIPNSQLVFGKYFTDHWLHVEWDKSSGWGDVIISPYSKIELEPSALVLHYAIECFEGMKAYKDKKGQVRLFRPMENMNRFINSAKRLCLPTFPQEKLLDAMKTLIKLEKDWIPQEKGFSLYIRPTLIATDPIIGVNEPTKALLFVILSPVGPYYPTGFKPVSLYAGSTDVRAWPGGTGCYKIGGNYAPGILPMLDAAKKGHQQILWLQDKKITEVGTMNLFCFWKNKQGEKELITAPLDGQILPGITRKSILELTREWKEFKVSEADWTIDSLVQALNDGRVIEIFGAGTAAIVSPVYKIFYEGKDYQVPCKDNAGELTTRLMNTLMAIQYGELASPWSVIVD